MSDTIYSPPGATFYSELDNADAGLIGTVGVQIIDKSDESVVLARTTVGIVESPTGSGRYQATLEAPTEKGFYTVFWDVGSITPSTTATDDLVVTYDLPTGGVPDPGGDGSTLEELRQEVIDRGYNYMKAATIDKYLNSAHRWLCAKRPWPFLEATLEGAPPLEIPELSLILAVSDVARECPLTGTTAQALSRSYPDLSQVGTAVFWYLEDKTLHVYPVSTGLVAVRIAKRPTVLVGTDKPLIPAEWQYLLIERAIVDCLRGNDEYDEARALQADVNEGVVEMAGALMLRNRQNNASVARSGGAGDYL